MCVRRMPSRIAGLLAVALVALLASACSGMGAGTGAPAGQQPDTGGPTSNGAWVGPLVKVNGMIYLLSREPALTQDQLGQVVGQVSRKLEMEATVGDGDSNFLPVGTNLYAIDGYESAEALAAKWQGQFVILKPNLNPNDIGTFGG